MNKQISKLKTKSIISIISLLGQSSYSAILGFFAFFLLTIKSGAYLLGIYNTTLAALSFFTYITNLGLAAAIIQKKNIKEIDLHTVFITQTILTLVAVVVGFLFTDKILLIYPDLPGGAKYLYWAVLLSFFILSLKTIPSVLLEKKIEIYKVVFIQAVENTCFYMTVIIMIFLGFEIESFIVAVLIRSAAGVVLIYILNPFRPKLQFSLASAKSLLSFGIPFQGNSFLALLKDDLLVIYLGSRIGLTNLGYVMFGKKYAEFSIRIIMDNVNRVAFPLFSKFQNNKNMLKKSLGKVLYWESALIFPMIIGAVFIFESLLKIIPGYWDKWGISLFSFYFFSLSSFFISLSTPFINLFNAIGKVIISLYFMVLWTVLLWILVLLLIPLWGFNGISIAFFIMSLTFILVYITAKKYVSFSLFEFIKPTIFAVVAMSFYLMLLKILHIYMIKSNALYVVCALFGASLIYLYIQYKNHGQSTIADLKTILIDLYGKNNTENK